ncbi:threonine/serine exporter family protein [Lichenibacterium ramalinae]|uniref:Threonine/serine exporter family protein n=1 Tax=Lichenibacterium ramalinae TaxID=2316527 RepID=A0A4Q2R8A4_9HYPH|nr:threonine/serine exporter family protein [Lichenibacterium ramalinae]RYB01680.1 hypothetical protein D3272_24785 [Lichenibacterium ramalinae]
MTPGGGSGEEPTTRAGDPGLMLVGRLASLLFIHGQTTEGTRVAVRQVGEGLGRDLLLLDAHWGGLTISADGPAADLRVPATPLAIDMGMVGAAEALVAVVRARRVGAGEALAALAAVERRPPVGLARFAAAAGLGAGALAVIFGATDVATVALAAASAGAGAGLRRAASRLSGNPFLQPFLAALLAGMVTAAALALRLPASANLVAACPCMVLVPGPHFLNGMLDLARARIPLGAARLAFAGLIVAAICAGLLIGLSPEAAVLPAGGAAAPVPLTADGLAAGLAVIAYGSFFNMPWRTLPAPVVVGVLAHALRWELLARGASVQSGAFVACLFVGAVMTPVAHRFRLPFGGLAFASVVSLIPGLFMFRTASGVMALLGEPGVASLAIVANLLGDAATACVVLLAMTAGLLVPKMLLDGVAGFRSRGSAPRRGFGPVRPGDTDAAAAWCDRKPSGASRRAE